MRGRALVRSSVCVALALACAAPPVALADADPPSDILPGQDSYLPYSSGSSSLRSSGARLAGLLAAARRRGHPFKVAVIASPTDLGGIPALFGKPRRYATFLAGEIRPFLPARRATLVIVMPQGIALAGADATASGTAAAARIGRPGGSDAALLTEIAQRVIRAVSAANDQPLPRVVAPAGGGGGTTGRWVLVAVLLMALTGGGALALVLRSRRPGAEPGGATAG
jgi:hypothetical protein